MEELRANCAIPPFCLLLWCIDFPKIGETSNGPADVGPGMEFEKEA